jgi:hypothetical protein
MFYANGMAKSSAGARKKIHGGSGLSGNDDSYGPGCMLFSAFNYVTNSDLSHTIIRSCRIPGISRGKVVLQPYLPLVSDRLFTSLSPNSWTRKIRMERTVFSQLMNCIMLMFDVI